MAIYWLLIALAILATQVELRDVDRVRRQGPRDQDMPDESGTTPSGDNGNTGTAGTSPALTSPELITSTPAVTELGRFQTVSQGPNPPPPSALNCGEFAVKCPTFDEIGSGATTETNPLVVRAGSLNPECQNRLQVGRSPCTYNNGDPSSNVCYGTYCLTISSGNDYCICRPDQIGHQCNILKPGSCDQATGFLPPQHYTAPGKRYRNVHRPDHGNVYARHFAASGTDCIRMCQWASGKCSAVNYGPLNGAQICELLSVIVTNGSIMQPWLIESPGWTFTTAVGKAAAI